MSRSALATAICFAAGYIALDINALHALRANQNTGLYLQSALSVLHAGTTFDQPDGKPHLLVHDQWLVYAILVPPVAIWPRPETAIVVQVVALGAAVVALAAFARTCGSTPRDASLLALAFALSPSVQGFAYDGFVAEDVVPIVAIGFAFALRRRALVPTLLFAELLLGIKEDEALFLAWFGALYAAGLLRRRDPTAPDAAAIARRERQLGLAVVALAAINGLGYAAIVAHFGYAPERPRYAFLDAHAPQQLAFLVEMLVPFAFAPLAMRWRLIAAFPFVAELFLAQDRSYPLYHIGAYYTAPLVACAALATASVAARRPVVARYAVAGSALMALFFNNASVLHIGRRPFSPDPQYAAARAWARTSLAVDFPCPDVGAWTVASPDPNARLIGCGEATRRAPRPAWRDVPLRSDASWTRGPARVTLR